jgi:hypothetical protein
VIFVWEKFGFDQSPYTTEPVPATEEGDQLLVGREAEIAKLESRIISGGTHPTLEGDNGVGKTSLLRVACYRLRKAFEEDSSAKLFIPIDEFFQPGSDGSVDDFIKRVYWTIASAIVKEHATLKEHLDNVPDITDIRTWLTSPVLKSGGGSVSVAGFGGGASLGRSINTGLGFADAGFKELIDTWLRQMFPSTQAGGFICVIDNLELLETTQSARNLLEAIRDPLLNRRGLRWILCGARGIIRTSVSSPRLEGRLKDPVEITPISDEFVAAAIKQRIELCRMHPQAEPPVGPETFRYLYDILNRNLRSAFKIAEDFSFWLLDEGEVSGNAATYAELFEVWLTGQADKHHCDTHLRNRAWQVFDTLAERDGWCSPGDYADFGFNSTAAMRLQIKALEQENLVVTSINDDADKRRKTISMTPRGWLVRYARTGYPPPTPRTPTRE